MNDTKHIRVERSYLVRRTETWELEVPSALDVAEWQDADPGAFDEHVSDLGRLLNQEHRVVDDDDLETTIIVAPEAITAFKDRDGWHKVPRDAEDDLTGRTLYDDPESADAEGAASTGSAGAHDPGWS